MQEDSRVDRNQNNVDGQQIKDAEEYDTFLYKFQQQIIGAWQPVPKTTNNFLLYLFLSNSRLTLAIVCLVTGIALVISAQNSEQLSVRYDNQCPLNTSSCQISFNIYSSIRSPIYFYYGLTGFFQNHRQYIKSFSTVQVKGQQISSSDAKDNCGGFATNAQLGFVTSITNATLVPTDIAFPCGPGARAYNLIKPELQSFILKDSTNNTISWDRTGIAWSSDINSKKNWDLTKQAFDVSEQDWLVWIRPSPKSNFYKLFAKIQADLTPGTYTLTFNNIFDANFGQKWFYLGKSNVVGNRDLFLGIAFTVLGGCPHFL